MGPSKGFSGHEVMPILALADNMARGAAKQKRAERTGHIGKACSGESGAARQWERAESRPPTWISPKLTDISFRLLTWTTRGQRKRPSSMRR